MRQPATILVVDDERAVRMMLEAALRAQGYRVQSVGSGGDARELLAGEEFDLVLLDLQLGDTDGIEILREIKQAWPATEVILLTAHGSINSAISALRHGAFDYLLKPAQVNDIRERVERGLEQRRTAQQRSELLQRISDSARALGLIQNGATGQVPAQPANSDRIEVGPLLLDLRRHGASLGNQMLALTRTEFALLTALAQQPDTALSYSTLSEAVYGRAQPEDEARAVDEALESTRVWLRHDRADAEGLLLAPDGVVMRTMGRSSAEDPAFFAAAAAAGEVAASLIP